MTAMLWKFVLVTYDQKNVEEHNQDFLRKCFIGIRKEVADVNIAGFKWMPGGNRKTFGNWFCAIFRLGYLYNRASDIETTMSVVGIFLQWCENYL